MFVRHFGQSNATMTCHCFALLYIAAHVCAAVAFCLAVCYLRQGVLYGSQPHRLAIRSLNLCWLNILTCWVKNIERLHRCKQSWPVTCPTSLWWKIAGTLKALMWAQHFCRLCLQKNSSVPGPLELCDALNIPEDFYGSTTAPKNLYQNVDQSMKSLGAIKIKGDQCFWLWVEKESGPNTQPDQWKTIGFMAGHVDGFHRAGDKNNPRWGTVKTNQYRHAGTDLHHGQCSCIWPVFGDWPEL